MLEITIPAGELYNEEINKFIEFKGCKIQLEHSLISLSKWESKWHKPFLKDTEKTPEEILDYIRCMTITQNVDPQAYNFITEEDAIAIKEYIEDPMSATVVTHSASDPKSSKTVTSELIYYWMIALNIPSEYQKWHLNRLMKLIEVCNAENAPPKKMSKAEIFRRNRELNEARKAALHSKG